MTNELASQNWKEKLSSRKFWMVIVTAILVIANDGLGLDLPEEAITKVVYLILGFVFTEGAADIVSRLKIAK